MKFLMKLCSTNKLLLLLLLNKEFPRDHSLHKTAGGSLGDQLERSVASPSQVFIRFKVNSVS